MKFKDYYPLFLERYSNSKKAKGIWFHGTGSKYLGSILKNGLIVDTKEKSWDSDPDASQSSPDRTSYGGIYLTKNFMTAYVSAGRVSRKTNSERLIVAVQAEPRTFVADEDSLTNRLSQYNEMSALYHYKIEKYGTEYAEYKEQTDAEKLAWAERFIKQMDFEDSLTPQLKQKITDLLVNEGFLAVITRVVSYVTDRYQWTRVWDTRKYAPEQIPNLPTPTEGEAAFRTFIDKLTRLMKYIPRKEGFSPTGRILQDITYRGQNRIVAVATCLEANRNYKIIVQYGKLPEEFLAGYKESITSKVEIVHP